jgi:plasmid stability protein
MAVLNIRDLPDEVQARLRSRAVRHGRSVEAEARAILATVCLEDEDKRSISALQDWVDSLYGASKPQQVVDELLAERRRESARE